LTYPKFFFGVIQFSAIVAIPIFTEKQRLSKMNAKLFNPSTIPILRNKTKSFTSQELRRTVKRKMSLLSFVWLVLVCCAALASEETGIADVAIVVDTSYSMEQTGIFSDVKKVLEELVMRIPSYYELLLVSFDTDARFMNHVEPFILMTKENKQHVLRAIKSPAFRATGEKTDLGRAMELTLSALRERAEKEKTRYQVMVLLTDGIHDPPRWSPYRAGWNLAGSGVAKHLTFLQERKGKSWYFAAVALNEQSQKIVAEIADAASGRWVSATREDNFDRQKLQAEVDEILNQLGPIQVQITDANNRILDALDFGGSFQGRSPSSSPLSVHLRSRLWNKDAGVQNISFQLKEPSGNSLTDKQIENILQVKLPEGKQNFPLYIKPSQTQTFQVFLKTKLKTGIYTGKMIITPIQGREIHRPVRFSIRMDIFKLIIILTGLVIFLLCILLVSNFWLGFCNTLKRLALGQRYGSIE